MFVDGEVGGKEQQSASMVLTEWGHYAFCQDMISVRKYNLLKPRLPPPRCEVEAMHDD